MTQYTQADFAERVLRDLGLIAAEEPVNADDLSFTEETIESVFEELSAVGIAVPNSSSETISSEVFVALSKRVGLDIAPAFGLMTVAEAEVAKPVTEMRLRAISARPHTGSVAESEYF